MKSVVDFIRILTSLDTEQKDILEANRKYIEDLVGAGNAQELLFALNELYHKACIPQILSDELDESDIPSLISTLDSIDTYIPDDRNIITVYGEFKLASKVICQQLQETHFKILLGESLAEKCTKLARAYLKAILTLIDGELRSVVKANELTGKKTLQEVDICYKLIGNVATKVITNKCDLVNTLSTSNLFEKLKGIDMSTVLGILQNNQLKEKRKADKERTKQLLISK